MKKIFILLLLSLFIGWSANAQDSNEAPAMDGEHKNQVQKKSDISLMDSEKSNNSRRKFCLVGNHERVVNQLLLKAKKRGATITDAYVRIMCQKTNPNKELD